MDLKQKVMEEAKSVGLASLYFLSWITVLVVLKALILAEYHIEISGISKALIGALIIAKVVLVLEHAPLGSWIQRRPAWVDVSFRTAMYALGVLVVLVLEKSIEGRHEAGGFEASLRGILQHADIYHVWTNVIVVAVAILGYNAVAVVRLHLGKGGLLRLFSRPVPHESSENHPRQ